MSRAREPGALAIVLHTHMPYVEGFGTWPFGEEWLWEAIAGSYLPLLDLLERDIPVTLSLTPVLCDQLEVGDVPQRFARFLTEVRGATHREDAAGLRAGGHELLALELERSWGDYERALARLDGLAGGLLEALAPHVSWTSSATHAVLPLLASDAAIRCQIDSGVRSHTRRFGDRWRGGFWLPECAHESSLEPILRDLGVGAVCVELSDHFGLGSREHLRPIATHAGPLLVPVDRSTMSLVWSDRGYPAAGPYRDYHHHTVHHHNPWNNAGEAYVHEDALALAARHAADFVARTRERLSAHGTGHPGGGLVVCALDTELLGHWWYEGVAWLEAVVEESARQGLELVRLDDALPDLEPAPALAPELAATSWGTGGDLSTWSGPAVADIAFAAREAELRVLAAAGEAGPAAVREMLALQASDWPFMVSRGVAVPYARERLAAHRAELAGALARGPGADVERLRNLAIDASPETLRAPA